MVPQGQEGVMTYKLSDVNRALVFSPTESAYL